MKAVLRLEALVIDNVGEDGPGTVGEVLSLEEEIALRNGSDVDVTARGSNKRASALSISVSPVEVQHHVSDDYWRAKVLV